MNELSVGNIQFGPKRDGAIFNRSERQVNELSLDPRVGLSSKSPQIRLGQMVTDSISGFTGIVTSRTEYLFGCVRCAVESKKLEDGKPIDAFFDEQRLIVVGEAWGEWPDQQAGKKERPGGPGDHPPARAVPPSR